MSGIYIANAKEPYDISCTLVTDNHGRLIDADRLIAVIESTTPKEKRDSIYHHILGLIENAPTILDGDITR